MSTVGAIRDILAWASRSMHYDAQFAPAPEEWLNTDQLERLDAIARFHGGREQAPIAVSIHAMLHLLAENQLAAGELIATTKLRTLVATV